MTEHRYVNQEIWICEPVQCIKPPTVGVVLSESDGHLYLARLIDDGTGAKTKVALADGDIAGTAGGNGEHAIEKNF